MIFYRYLQYNYFSTLLYEIEFFKNKKSIVYVTKLLGAQTSPISTKLKLSLIIYNELLCENLKRFQQIPQLSWTQNNEMKFLS